MEKDFKIVLSGNKHYKEIYINSESKQMYIGNMDGCDIIWDADIFTIPFCVLIYLNEEEKWEFSCSDNVYISDEGVIKQITRVLSHGDNFALKYNDNNAEIFKFSFVINFENNEQDYRKIIDIECAKKTIITVGGNDNYDICIADELMQDSEFSLIKGDSVYVDNIRCPYGLYVNGNLVKNRTLLKDCDFITILGYNFYFCDGALRTTEKGKIYVNGLPCTVENISYGNMQYPRFYRNTRIVSKENTDKINILVPPDEPAKPERNIIKNLLPAIVMLALTVVLRGFMGSGGTFVIFSVCTMSMGIGTTIATFVGERRAYKKSKIEREEKYNRYIEKKRKEIETARQDEKDYLENLYYTKQEEYKLTKDFSPSLFGCKVDDIDFLHINLGIGKIEASRKIEYKEREQLEIEDDLQLIPEQLEEEYRYITDVPIVCDLVEDNIVGIVGDDFHMQEIVKSIIVDICVRHYYTDVRLIILADEKTSEYIEWARYIPHLNNEHTRNIVCDEESKNSVFEFMYKLLSEREDSKTKTPHYVVIALNDMGIKSHPVSKYIEKSGDFGFSFIFFEEHEDRLPMGCKKIIRFTTNKRDGVLIDAKDGNNKLAFEYLPISDTQAKEISLKLSPVYTEEISLESSLVKNITLFELLGISNVKKLNLSERWGNSITEKSLAAPLGVNSKKDIVYLDLHEKAHGPHGLVAGTTGSGKSEILQSYILSMATLYHPHEVSFMIIDFKGGGMVNQFKNLPHLIGAITNIDGKEIDRSLKSIKAELRKRQRCFAEVGVNHIDAYINKSKAGETPEIIPHLIVIVDEFAELKAEQPEFMKELISAARIGRSLGVHLILATQKPAGQVNEQIWSNSKFKLCLKVQNKEDSNEVLKSPLAAEIREPGRAYLQVGNNEIFELFQSAYSGAPADVSATADKKEFYVARVGLSGKREVVYQYKNKKTNEDVTSQLNAIVDYVAEYCESAGISRAPSICLPSLPENITNTEAVSDIQNKVICNIGIYDDPDNQYQGMLKIDFSSSNLFVVGVSQMGKTNLIQNIIKSVSIQFSPRYVCIYGLDFGSMILKKYEKLNHVGGVAVLGEDEKIKNLFKLLKKELADRKVELRRLDASSYTSCLETGITPFPQIIFFIDNYAMYKEIYGVEYEDELLYLAREGRNVGISIIITASQTNGMGMKLLSNFDERIAFSCNDKSDYSALFGSCKMEPKEVPGRALMLLNKAIYEMQTFLAFEGEKEMERMKNVDLYIDNINCKYPDEQANLIPMVPEKVNWNYLFTKGDLSRNIDMMPVGVGYANVSVECVDLSSVFMLSLIGAKMPDIYDFTKNIFRYLYETKYPYVAHIVDNAERQLMEFTEYENTNYMPNLNDITNVLNDILSELMERHSMVVESGKHTLKDKPLIVVIINEKEINNMFTTGSELTKIFDKIQKQYKEMKVLFVFTYIEDASVAFGASGLLKIVKEMRKSIIYTPIVEHKFFDITSGVQKSLGKNFNEGDATLLLGNNFARIKVITP